MSKRLILRLFFLFIFAVAISTSPVFSQPHIVGGKVTMIGHGAPANGKTHFKCYLHMYTGSSEDTLTEASTDCGYLDGFYWIQTNNFGNPWVSGLSIHVDLWETECGGSTSGNVVLSNDALDTLNLVIYDVSLPVQVSAFSAKPSGDGISIQWITQSEVENAGFILERTEDEGSQWITIASYQTHASLVGQGSTSSMTTYDFLDRMVEPGHVYRYRLSDVSERDEIHIVDVIVIASDRPAEPEISESPETTSLSPPSPNPFNPSTRIRYQLSEAAQVELTVYDIRGNRVRTLIQEEQDAGNYSVYWHGRNMRGLAVPSGTYMLVLRTPDQIQNQRAILVR
jgi:hypothetical protein